MTSTTRWLICAVIVLCQPQQIVGRASAEPIEIIRGSYLGIDPLFTDPGGVEFFTISQGTIATDHPLILGKALNTLRFTITGIDIDTGAVRVSAENRDPFINTSIGEPVLILDAIVDDIPGAIVRMPPEGGIIEEFSSLGLVRIRIPATIDPSAEFFSVFGSDPDLAPVKEADLIWDIVNAFLDTDAGAGSLVLAGGVPRLVYTTTPTVTLTIVPRGTPVPLPNIPEPSTSALALIGLSILGKTGALKITPGSAPSHTGPHQHASRFPARARV